VRVGICRNLSGQPRDPFSLLRQPDEESRQREYQRFIADLGAAAGALGEA